MAPFNPQQQDIPAPNYLGMAKSIDQPRPDEVASSILKGVGDLINDGSKAYKTINEEAIDKEVEQTVKPLQNDYIAGLEQLRDQSKNDPAGLLKAAGGGSADAEVPSEVQAGLDDVGRTTEASKSGKFRSLETYYDMRLNNVTSSLRDKYPQWVQYIDQQVDQNTKRGIGNDYANRLLADINANVSNSQKALGNLYTFANKEGADKFPNNVDVLKGIETGRITSITQIAEAYKPYRDAIFKAETNKRKFEMGEEDDKTAARNAEDELINYTSTEGSRLFHTFKAQNSLSSSKQIMETLRAKPNPTNAEAIQYYQSARQNEDDARSRMKAEIFKGGPSSMGARISRMPGGLAKINGYLDDAISEQRLVTESIIKGRPDVAAFISAANSGKTQDVETQILSLPNMAVIKGLTTYFKDSPDFQKHMVEYSINHGMGNEAWYNEAVANLMKIHSQPSQQPGPVYNPAAPAYTLDKAMLTLKDLEKHKFPVSSEEYRQVVNAPNAMVDPSAGPNVRFATMQATFDKGNSTFLRHLDRTNGDREQFFNGITSDGVIKEVEKQSQDPSKAFIKQDFVNTTKEMFRLHLYTPALRELQTIQSDPRFVVGWDSEKHHIVSPPTGDVAYRGPKNPNVFNAGAAETAGMNVNLNLAARTIATLNTGLDAMVRVAKVTGEDPDAFVYNLLKQDHIDPKGTTVASQIMRNIVTGRNAQDNPAPKGPSSASGKPTGALKQTDPDGGSSSISNYDVGEPVRSLSSWLKNPGNEQKPVTNQPKNINWGDSDILSMDVNNVPPGMTIQQMLDKLGYAKK